MKRSSRNSRLLWLIPPVMLGIAIAGGQWLPVPAWLWMWMLAGALWISFKLQTFLKAGGLSDIRPLFFMNIGMETDPFRRGRELTESRAPLPNGPIMFVLAGLFLVFVLLPGLHNPTALGWIGLVAMLCLFHFGSFAVLAWMWNRSGFPVQPIMNAPWKARTLGEFWGPRWNRAFSDWARVWIFRPFVRKLGVVGGTLAGFSSSGIAHEFVISLPAKGGFGLPTVYFLLQGAGVLLQRRHPISANPVTTIVCVLLPAPLLFNGPFCKNVFAPMIEALLQLLHLQSY